MSDLYDSLQRERQKLKEYRHRLYKDLPSIQQQFTTLKSDFTHMLTTCMQHQGSKSQRGHDMPLQINTAKALTNRQSELYEQETHLI